jgi:hypothetical protein
MDGNATAEVFITRQWLPDSPKTPASLWQSGGHWQANRSSMKPFAIGAASWLLLVISPSPGAFRNRSLHQWPAVTAEISQNINSQRSGPMPLPIQYQAHNDRAYYLWHST